MKSVLTYLHQVLGIRSVVLPTEVPDQSVPAFFILYDQDQLSTGALALAEKMILALKLPQHIFKTFHHPATQISEMTADLDRAQVVLNLGTSQGEWVEKNYPFISVFHTPSPEVLIQKADLKKQAWAEMQKALAAFQKITSSHRH